MNATQEMVHSLVTASRIASLGTLHDGRPFVSMVPFAALPDGEGLVIHVSQLASHTADMLNDSRVSLMVAGAESEGVPAQAVPRFTITGEAHQIAPTETLHASARTAYLGRFPDAAAMFELPDFSLFVIRPESVRAIGGFARATTIDAKSFAEACRG